MTEREPLYTDEQLKYIAFDAASTYLFNKSRKLNTPMTMLFQEKMIELRDAYEARIAELEAQLSESQVRLSQTEAAWEPILDLMIGEDDDE